jgi:hypothetical protein
VQKENRQKGGTKEGRERKWRERKREKERKKRRDEKKTEGLALAQVVEYLPSKCKTLN